MVVMMIMMKVVNYAADNDGSGDDAYDECGYDAENLSLFVNLVPRTSPLRSCEPCERGYIFFLI